MLWADRMLGLALVVTLTACGGGDHGDSGQDGGGDAGDGGDADDSGHDAELDRCEPGRCTEPNTICVDQEGGWSCECAPGAHRIDDDCVLIPECVPGVCGDHGECDDADGEITCTCEEGWTGDWCERCDEGAGYHDDGAGGCTTDACTPNPCPPELLCIPTPEGEPECSCPAGTHDEEGACVPDTTCLEGSCNGLIQ